jgi:integrase
VRARRSRTGITKSYIVMYDGVGGLTRKITLGSVALMTHAQAREEARKVLARVRLGEDPAGDKSKARIKAKDTVGALLVPYLTWKHGELRPRSFLEVRRHLEGHAAPLHNTAITDLSRRAVASLLAEITRKNGPVASNRVRSSLLAFCGWCVGSGYIETNPADYTPKATENGPRKRLLSDAELRAIWHACDDGFYGSIVRLLLLCGLRRTEIGGLMWAEVDLDQAILTLPAERTKAHRQFVVPLSPPALVILKAQPMQAHGRVFGLRGTGFQHWSSSKAELDARLIATGHKLKPWGTHDFRRAVSTTLNERLAVRPEVVECILGHVVPGIAGIYNLAQHVEERRRALERWAVHLLGEGPAQVLTLPRRG